jgi:hypothetical protein
MATKTYGTTSTTNVGFVTSSNRSIVSSFTPNNWGGNTNPQEGRALYNVTKITVYARLGDADPGTNTINVVMGSTAGTFNKANTLAYSTYDGSTQLGSSYKYMAGTVSAVIGSDRAYYSGLSANGPGGAYITRGTASGETAQVVETSSGSTTYTWSNSQQYMSFEYYGLPNAPSSISATTTGQNSVTVTFSQVAASGVATAADGYKIQYKESSAAEWSDFTTVSGYPPTGVSVSGLSAGTAYNFRVAAYDSAISNVVSNATGPWSSAANATTESGTPPVPAPTWSGSFNSGQVNTPYVQDYARATGHDTSYGPIEITSGSLPPGLSGSADGEYFYVSGTPTTAGTYTFNLTAENSGDTSTAGFSITISALPAPSWVDQTLSSTATVGVRYLDYLSATNVSSWSYSGTLPPGIGFSSGTFDGYPTTVGSYTFTVYASNAVDTAQKTFTITVVSALLNGGARMVSSNSSTALSTYKRYDGGSWITLSVAKRFNGSSWEDI